MAKYLVIVESPAKVKTIKKFLGSNYEVVASNGHVRDMPKSTMGIDFENDYEPKYITIRGKGEKLAELRRCVKKADKVYLATDPDREGEAISWHLSKALKLENKKSARITFNEITKPAVKESLKHPREINMNLVDAQQARRVMDRMVGYSISPLLWMKIKRGLSAGRVQSVALRMLCDREEEINAFIPKEYWDMDAVLKYKNKEFTVSFYGDKKGKVEIQIDYTNNEKQDVDGKELYVPFVVTTGTMLPTKTDSNIEVTNGKVISNGSSNIIMAVAAPGLSKNYDNNEELEKLNSVTIKYDTTKFKLNSLMSVATPSLLSETDINFDDLNDVYDSVDTLNSSFDQIIAGGQTLQSGLKQYASKYSEFDQGVGSLKTGAASALVGSQKLTTGIETLYNGLVTLDGKSATLVAGAKQVFNTLLTTTQTQINNQLATTGMSIELTIDNYQTVLNGLMAKLPAENQPSVKTALAQLDSYNKFYQGLQSYTGGVAQLKEGAKSAVDGSKQLSEGLSSLSDGSDTLVQASSQLKTASNQLAQGSDALVDGLTLFKSKGLDKISSVLNDTVKKDVDTTQKLVDLANDYKTFADSKDGVEAKTKFIMIIDSKSKK